MQELTTYNFNSQRRAFSWSYVILFMAFYAVIPIFFAQESLKQFSYNLVMITSISMFGYLLALNINTNIKTEEKKIVLDFKRFSMSIYILYIIVIGIIFITSGNIPLIESLKGADQYDLIVFREDFLKNREGWESYLGYIITIIDTTIFPYIIVNSFKINFKYKYLFLFTFIFYSICFLEKAYFLKIVIPLFFFFYFTTKNKKAFLIWGGACVIGLISLMFLLTKFDSSDYQREDPFFSILYTPNSISSAILWRSIAVPVITALQGLELFAKTFNEELFYGSTSSFFAFLFGQERSNFERILYFDQFGGTGTGNANQCYLIESFINFGYVGVLLFSYVIGKLIRGIIMSKDLAALCIIPLFIYNLFNAGLIGLLLGNGYLMFFLFIKFFKVKY